MKYPVSVERYEKVLEHVRNSECPICGSQDDISYQDINVMSNHVSQGASCGSCDSEWTEYYTASGIEIYTLRGIKIDPTKKDLIEDDLSDLENPFEILQAVLKMKKILPALIGIDDELDRIISERLKK